jgi:hypothetical protein
MTDLDGGLFLGFLAGLYLFFRGFRVYREYRVLADTPEIPIRSIAMGLVHVHGKAKSDKLVNSPVTNTPCIFYKVGIEKYQTDSKGSGSWSHVATDSDGVPFLLEDQSGRVLVNAHGAELDLIESGKRETGGAFGKGWGKMLGGVGDSTLTTGSEVRDYSLVTYAESVIAGRGGFSADNLVTNLAKGSLTFFNSGTSRTGRYRLTECCVLAEHWYDVTGTCIENPSPKDEHDRNMILKGQNEPTFLISWRAEKQIESVLRKRAALQILGGAALSVVCLGLLLKNLGWL